MPADKPKILIAEDNPGLARVLTFKFDACGYDPITCSDGGHAWDAFEREPIAAAVCDHEMPVMTGLDLIRRIRQHCPEMPCFLITGRQLELVRDPRVKELRVADVFGKPFSPGAVVEAVGAAIGVPPLTGRQNASRTANSAVNALPLGNALPAGAFTPNPLPAMTVPGGTSEGAGR